MFITQEKLKRTLTSIIRNSFIFKNGNLVYIFLLLGNEDAHILKERTDGKTSTFEIP